MSEGRRLVDALERDGHRVFAAFAVTAAGDVKVAAHQHLVRGHITDEEFERLRDAVVECLTQIRTRPLDDLEILGESPPAV